MRSTHFGADVVSLAFNQHPSPTHKSFQLRASTVCFLSSPPQSFLLPFFLFLIQKEKKIIFLSLRRLHWGKQHWLEGLHSSMAKRLVPVVQFRKESNSLNTGPGDFVAHAHEGLELADASGFVAVSVFSRLKLPKDHSGI